MTVVTAPPDGYTLLMASTASLAIQMTYSAGRLEYDLRRSLTPISKVAEIPNGLFVTPILPVDTLKAFVAYVKARPGQYTCASSGVGGLLHLTCELFKKTAGIAVLHVPFKGSTAFRPELIEGRITMAFDNVPVYVPLVAAGKLKALAVTTAQRAAILPDVPTTAELGMPGLLSMGLFGLFAPLNTPADAIARVSRESIAILREPKIRETLVKQGIEPGGSTPQDLGGAGRARGRALGEGDQGSRYFQGKVMGVEYHGCPGCLPGVSGQSQLDKFDRGWMRKLPCVCGGPLPVPSSSVLAQTL